jgi:hypothetical protein
VTRCAPSTASRSCRISFFAASSAAPLPAPVSAASSAAPPERQLAYLRASPPRLQLPADALTELLRADAAAAPWAGARRGNALAAAVHRGGTALVHAHGPLCDSVRVSAVQQPPGGARQSAPDVRPAGAVACDGSVRQVSACGGRGGAAVSVCARTDFTVQLWRADLAKPRAQLRPVVRRIFDTAVLDTALGDDEGWATLPHRFAVPPLAASCARSLTRKQTLRGCGTQALGGDYERWLPARHRGGRARRQGELGHRAAASGVVLSGQGRSRRWLAVRDEGHAAASVPCGRHALVRAVRLAGETSRKPFRACQRRPSCCVHQPLVFADQLSVLPS